VHALSREILGLIGISALIGGMLFVILSYAAATIVENYCFYNDIVMTELEWLDVDRWIFSCAGLISTLCFSVVFLALSHDKIAYIRTLTEGIHRLRMGNAHHPIPLQGKNELTELADAINFMSATQASLREKEQKLAQEKEQLIRTLSHDIRTPLTSVLAYAEYLTTQEDIPPELQKSQLQTIQKKALQIRDLTEVLLDGGKRNLEHFSDARLLFMQLAAEFEEGLEDGFTVQTDLSGCPAFPGSFDVQELRRIFDNLSTNVRKYAAADSPVCLVIGYSSQGLSITQTNSIREAGNQESGYQLGILSIRRIAQHYGGNVTLEQSAHRFCIRVNLSKF